jgi:sarcosine oxidase subunit delta
MGTVKEWWFHREGCGSWFVTWRDTVRNLEVSPPKTDE